MGPLILFHLNPTYGVITVGPADEITDTPHDRGPRAAAALQRAGFVLDPALGIYRQPPTTSRIEQLRNAALVTAALVDLGYGVSASSDLLTAYSALADPAGPVRQLHLASTPQDVSRLFHETVEHRSGLLAQLQRFIVEVGVWSQSVDDDRSPPLTQRLHAVESLLHGLHTLLNDTGDDLGRLTPPGQATTRTQLKASPTAGRTDAPPPAGPPGSRPSSSPPRSP